MKVTSHWVEHRLCKSAIIYSQMKCLFSDEVTIRCLVIWFKIVRMLPGIVVDASLLVSSNTKV